MILVILDINLNRSDFFYEDTPRRGIRQHMEHTFEEAIRSEEEKGSKWSQNVSTFGLLGASETIETCHRTSAP